MGRFQAFMGSALFALTFGASFSSRNPEKLRRICLLSITLFLHQAALIPLRLWKSILVGREKTPRWWKSCLQLLTQSHSPQPISALTPFTVLFSPHPLPWTDPHSSPDTPELQICLLPTTEPTPLKRHWGWMTGQLGCKAGTSLQRRGQLSLQVLPWQSKTQQPNQPWSERNRALIGKETMCGYIMKHIS